MENNKVIGYLLIILLLVTYYTYFVPNYEVNDINEPKESTKKDEISIEKIEKTTKLNNEIDQIKSEKQKDIIIENNDIVITFSNQGAYIKKVILKNHFTLDNKQLDLINEKSSFINYNLIGKDSIINFNKIVFNHKIKNDIDSTIINFFLESKNEKKINLTYKIPKNGYVITNKIKLTNQKYDFKNLNFHWSNNVIHHEKNYDYEKSVTTIYYYDINDEYDYLSASSTDVIEENIDPSLKWISTKQQFFSSAIITNNVFNKTLLKTIYNKDTSFIKTSIIKTEIPFQNQSANFLFYFGPNKYEILKNITDGFDQNVYLGWWGVNSFNKYIIIPIFNLLEKSIDNYGFIILYCHALSKVR